MLTSILFLIFTVAIMIRDDVPADLLSSLHLPGHHFLLLDEVLEEITERLLHELHLLDDLADIVLVVELQLVNFVLALYKALVDLLVGQAVTSPWGVLAHLLPEFTLVLGFE